MASRTVHDRVPALQPGVGGEARRIVGAFTARAHAQVELAGDVALRQQALGDQHLDKAEALPGGVAGGSGYEVADCFGFLALAYWQFLRRYQKGVVLEFGGCASEGG